MRRREARSGVSPRPRRVGCLVCREGGKDVRACHVHGCRHVVGTSAPLIGRLGPSLISFSDFAVLPESLSLDPVSGSPSQLSSAACTVPISRGPTLSCEPKESLPICLALRRHRAPLRPRSANSRSTSRRVFLSVSWPIVALSKRTCHYDSCHLPRTSLRLVPSHALAHSRRDKFAGSRWRCTLACTNNRHPPHHRKPSLSSRSPPPLPHRSSPFYPSPPLLQPANGHNHISTALQCSLPPLPSPAQSPKPAPPRPKPPRRSKTTSTLPSACTPKRRIQRTRVRRYRSHWTRMRRRR